MESQTNFKGNNEKTNEILVSFGNNVTNTTLTRKTLDEIINMIKSNENLKTNIDLIRQSEDENQQKKLKVDLLPYFNLGIFEPRFRESKNLFLSEYLLFDIDHLENVQEEILRIKADPRVFLAFISARGNGIKFAVKVNEPISNAARFSQIYSSVSKQLSEEFGRKFDATSDACRACFLSHDPAIYVNLDSEPIDISKIPVLIPDSDNKINLASFTEIEKEKVNIRVDFLKDKKIPYEDWIKIGFALASLGEEGRIYFMKFIENPHFKDTEKELNQKFDNLLAKRKGNVSIGTLYHIASKYGYSDFDGKYFAFIEKNTNTYAYFDKDDKTLSIGVSKSILENILKSADQYIPAKFEALKLVFDVNNDLKIDLDRKVFNLFTPSEYMLNPPNSSKIDPVKDFPYIQLILMNLIPENQLRDRFINWLAGIMQTRKKQLTAWVLKGEPGAGKNLFLQHVLKPLFGKEQVIQVEDEQLQSQFNGWLKNVMIIAFNEVAHDNITRNSIKSKIKAIITDSEILINEKNIKTYLLENHVNCLFFSNEGVPLLIEEGDRRFNVVTTGRNLNIQGWFYDPEAVIATIADELKYFAQYLTNYKYSAKDAKTAITNEDKDSMISAGMNKFAEFAKHLKNNDISWFGENITSPFFLLPESLDGKVKKTKALELFNTIYANSETSLVNLSKQLRIYGILPSRLREMSGDREQYFIWDSVQGCPVLDDCCPGLENPTMDTENLMISD